jgi:chromosome segregation ATPase
MFGRIGFGEKPLLDRLEGARNHFDVGGSIPPLDGPMPAFTSFTPPTSPVDVVSAAPHEMLTALEGMDAISRELFEKLATSDEESKTLFLEWNGFRERLTTFLVARKDERRLKLENKIAELSRTGRACIDRIQQLRHETGEEQSRWNSMQAGISQAKAELNAVMAANPDGDGTSDAMDQSFALPAEREQWRESVAAARAVVAEQEAQARPVEMRMNELASKINAENRTLQTVKEQRRLLRLELVDGVERIVGSGLGGRPGKSAL